MLNSFLYRFGQKLSVILPLKLSYKIAVFLADLHRLFSPKDRAAVKDNLKTIFPEASDSTIDAYLRDAFRNFAKYLIDFFRFELIDKNYIDNNISRINFDIVDKALSGGKGVIVVSAHIANWELAGITMAILGYPIACVALSHRNKSINDFFIRQRELKGLEVISLGRAAFGCLQTLKKNKLLALVGDRDFTQAGLAIDFFGVPTLIPKGPAAFSLKTGAPIVIGMMIRDKDDKFRFIYEGPLEIERTNDLEKDMKILTEKYVRILEKYIKDYPGQWLMFRRFWEPVDKNSCE